MTYHASIAERIAWTIALSATDAKVLQALASCGDWETGQRCYPRLKTIAARSGLSIATVTRRLRRLEDLTPPGPWIVATARRHRHSTTYDIQTHRLATRPPKEQQMTTDAVLDPPKSDAQNEQQGSRSVAQNEQPTSDQDLVPDVRTHTPRAREDAPAFDAQNEQQIDPPLPLVGQTPPSRCLHPHAHAWCEGRVHVPRDLHFEFLDKLGTQPGESPAAKAGRLIAFYAATMRHLSPAASIGDSYAFWKAAFHAWVDHTGQRAAAAATIVEQTLNRERITDRIARIVAEGRAEREKKTG